MIWCLLGCLIALVAEPARAKDSAEFFQEKIAPLLARRCLECHNRSDLKGGLDLSQSETAFAGGDSGPVLVPGKREDSLLWQRVSDDEMPPEDPLTDGEKQLLDQWIAAGAGWGGGAIDPFLYTTDRRAGYDWWAWQPIGDDLDAQLKELRAATGGRARNPIDVFVLARLEEHGLSLSPLAGRRTLLRRLSFDLLGLPPSAEEVRDFERDLDPGAHERVVERLLGSPHYGERWARHWLDVARFGESQGFERDKLRSNAWRYRDWLIEAFNGDMPYDRFVRWQLAGDVLHGDDPSAVVATGFLVAGPYDEVGQSQQSAAMKAVVRQDELEDIVSSVCQTFLGLTVNCARCHDHKFDPVRQSEYYQLTAALAGVRHGERQAVDEQLRMAAQRGMSAIAARMRQLQLRLAELEAPVRRRVLAAREKARETVEPPRPIARWDFGTDLADALGSLHGQAHGSPRVEGGRLVVDGQSFVVTAPLASDLSEKTLEAWVSLADLEQRGGGVISIQTLDGKQFDALVYGEREPRQWLAGSNNFVRTQSFEGPAEQDADQQLVHVALVYQDDGTIRAYRHGQPYGKPYKSDGPVTFKAGEAHVLFGLRHRPPGGNRLLSGALDRAQLYDRALSPLEVAVSAGVGSDYVSEEEIVAGLEDEDRDLRRQLHFEIEQLKTLRGRYGETSVYAVTPSPPEATHVLLRGDTAQPAEAVAAAGVAALVGVDADFGLPPDAPDAERRRLLAQWITDYRNPLFARVMVNRLWHYHFGVGLVDTPNDLGFNGGRPTHPLLLDWLARELIRRDWSLKSIQRLIVTSAVYRQSSRLADDAVQIDADNRLLWRKTPLRLEAEAIRDAILAVSGQLNTPLYGPGFHDFRTFNFNSQFYEMLDPIGATFNRRSLYRTWVRSGRSQFLDVFDCPDPSAKAPRRAVTTTPLQALSLLNDPFVLRMADRFAERVQNEAGPGAEVQVDRAYELAYGRGPDSEELQLAVELVQRHGLAALCRVLFNTNEFLHVD